MIYQSSLLLVTHGCKLANISLIGIIIISLSSYLEKHQAPLALLFPLCCISLGIILSRGIFCTPLQSITLLLLCCLAAIINKKTPSKQAILWICSGASLVMVQQQEHSMLAQKLFGTPITLTGTILECSENASTQKALLLTHISKVATKEKVVQAASFCVTLYTANKSYRVGDIISLNNVKLSPANNDAFITPCSFADHLKRTGCLCSYFITEKNNVSLVERSPFLFTRWLFEKRDSLAKHIKSFAPPGLSTFIDLIFFGNKNISTPDTIKIPFLRWGITHYLARSGLHIALLIAIWTKLFSLLPAHILIKRLLLLGMGFFYHLFSHPSISFIRSLLLFSAALSGKAMQQTPQTTHLLLLVCLLTLLNNPIQLFFLDFQLTFLLTFCLIASTDHQLFK